MSWEQLADRNQEQNKHAEIITKDYIQKTSEYAAEGKNNAEGALLLYMLWFNFFPGLKFLNLFDLYFPMFQIMVMNLS